MLYNNCAYCGLYGVDSHKSKFYIIENINYIKLFICSNFEECENRRKQSSVPIEIGTYDLINKFKTKIKLDILIKNV